MKKLMIAAAIVCAAAFAQAASYTWTCGGSFYWGDSSATGAELTGSTIYAFDGNTYSSSAIINLLATEGTTCLNNALGSGTVDEYAGYSFSESGKQISAEGGYINAFLIAVDEDGAYAASLNLDPIEVTDGVIASGASIGADWAIDNLPGSGNADWTKIYSEDVPEPTSGLLLLLGLSGLALRRRRA